MDLARLGPARRGLLPALLPLALALLVPACTSGESAPDGVDVRVDTLPGGVLRVVNVPPPEGLEPTWVGEPGVRIGSLEGEGPTTFGEVRDIGVLLDGRIVVLESQAQELRLFGADGTFLRELARKGQGPGELQSANGLEVGPDGLIRVHDVRNARLSFFDPDEGFVRSAPLEVMRWGWTWDGVVDSVGRTMETTLANIGEERWEVVKIWDEEGRWTDTVAIRASEPSSRDPDDDPPGVYSLQTETMGMMSRVPFWPAGARVTDPRGFFWSKPGDVNDYRVVQTTFTGDTVLVFESRRAPLSVSEAERDSAIARLRERFGQEMDWSKIPAEKPVVEGLSLDDRGRVWVRVTSDADTATTYDVFERDGRYAGAVVVPFTIPSWFAPVVKDDRVHALTTDEFDVPYVATARLATGDGGAGR